jgi:cytochrome P450
VSVAAPYLDIESPDFAMHSREVAQAQAESWYARTPYGIAVLRHAEITRLIKDPRLHQGSRAWPRHNGVEEGPFAEWWSRILLCREGADHLRLKRLVTPAFSPRILAVLQPAFERLAHEVIDGFSDGRQCEFMSQFAEPYATRVLTLLLGIPDEDWRMIADWASCTGLALGIRFRHELPRIDDAVSKLFGYADALIARHRAAPSDEFLSQLVQAQVDGDRLSDQELRDMVVLLIFGGIDTTRNQLSLGLRLFMEHPAQWELLAARPELAANAVEEIMRLQPTTTWVSREAAENFEFDGVTISRGTTVHLLAAAAGSDPEAYPEAGFDITQRRTPHHAFGGGIHYCLGHAVARSDMAVAFKALSARLRNLTLDGAARWLPDSGNTGAEWLPLRFDLRHP